MNKEPFKNIFVTFSLRDALLSFWQRIMILFDGMGQGRGLRGREADWFNKIKLKNL